MTLPGLPDRRRQAVAIAVAVSALCYVGDFFTFASSSYLKFLGFYVLIGLSVLISTALAFRLLRPRRLPGELAAALGAVLVGMIAPNVLAACVESQSTSFGDYWGYCVYGGVIAAAVVLAYAHRRSMEALVDLRARTSEAQYELLKARMQPHFLFNALNSLSELIASDPAQAERMAEKLSDLYRAMLTTSAAKTAPVSEEVAIVRSYLEVEALRFGERLRFELHVSPDAANAHLPCLVAQTLVENAVKHGIAPARGGGQIALDVRRTAPARYRFSLRNTGSPFEKDRPEGTGLSNTRQRLALLYGDGHQFSIRSLPDFGTEVSFEFTGAVHG